MVVTVSGRTTGLKLVHAAHSYWTSRTTEMRSTLARVTVMLEASETLSGRSQGRWHIVSFRHSTQLFINAQACVSRLCPGLNWLWARLFRDVWLRSWRWMKQSPTCGGCEVERRKQRICLGCLCFQHTHTTAGSENEIFQPAISAANSITEGTCTKSCDFPDGEIGKGWWLQTVNNRTSCSSAGMRTETIRLMWTGESKGVVGKVQALSPSSIKWGNRLWCDPVLGFTSSRCQYTSHLPSQAAALKHTWDDELEPRQSRILSPDRTQTHQQTRLLNTSKGWEYDEQHQALSRFEAGWWAVTAFKDVY